MTDIEELTTVNVKPTIIKEIRQDIFPCTNSLPRDGDSPLTFRVPHIHDAFLDISNIYLKIQAQIVKTKNDAALTAAESKTVSIINYLGTSLWKNVEVFMNNVQVYDSHNMYPFITYLTTLLYGNAEAKRTYLTNAFYYEDTQGLFAALDFSAAGTNKGAVKRSSLVDESQIFETYTRVFADQFNQQRLLVNDVELMLRFTPHNINFYLLQAGFKPAAPPDAVAANLDVKLKILHASLHINRVFLSEDELKKQTAKIAREPFLYPYVEIKPYIFVHSNRSTIFDRTLIEGVLPERVYLVLLEETKFNGDFGMNSFEFNHFHVTELQWVSAGRMIPAQAMTMDFRNKKYTRAYQWLFEHVHNDKLELTREQFVGGYTVFCTDLTLGLDANADEYINKQNVGNLRLQLKFERAPNETLVFLLLAEYERVMSINAHREIEILDPNNIKTE